ncbi:MAG: aminopeptidase P family protein [Agathobacter sp.]|nr:aminopeptidase P family protein [Agathobacter sp.]
MIPTRLQALRNEMAKRDIAIYIVPTADFHESEYVGEYFTARKYITGFTGSAGIAVITQTEAGLWTDARYFIQAAAQLEGSTVTLYKMGEEGVPTVDEYIEKTLEAGQTLGFDGRVVNSAWGKKLETIVAGKEGKLAVEEDLVDIIWEERPELSAQPVHMLDIKYTGKGTVTKLADIRKVMEEKGADIHLLTSLYDIAWILNIRGNDIHCVPVVLSYLAITKSECIWFVQEEILTDELAAYLKANTISTRPYNDFYEYVKTIDAGHTVLMNKSVVNYRICNSIAEGVEVIDEADPSTLMKSQKNETELKNTREAHRKDAVAMCKFMYWLKTNIGKISMTEISASDYLEELRKEQGAFELSFDTICGYGAHGAIIHYSATPETDVELKPEGLLLVDSGGQYLEGTTDITRTFALGPVTEEMKSNFTRVLRSNLNLANAKFLYGCSGINLDVLARQPLWEANLDYKHGTGHGVGHVLNVHEGPNGIHWGRKGYAAALEEGMITTDEPGIYIEGGYGIRLENELVCRKGEKNTYGQFMYFENLTFVPFDLDAVDVSQMNETEKGYLNAYHKAVYEKIAPHLTTEEAEWLKIYTREI